MPEDKHNIELGELADAKCDAKMIQVALTNLLTNAIKYSNKKDEPRIWISSNEDAESVTYSIRDNGVGFDMKYEERMFGVFQRLHKDSEFPGTGVGLAIVKRIVEKHNGQIWANSKLNEGSTFYIRLPKF